jgi:hypothetical protein
MNSSVASWPSAAFADVALVVDGQRAGGLQLRDPLDLDEAHAARAHRRAKPGLVAEHRDLDARDLGRLDEARSLRD